MKTLKTTSTPTQAKVALLTFVLAIGGLLAVFPTSATAGRSELTTSLEVAEGLVARLARGPVPAAEAFRQINITLADGGSDRHALKERSSVACCEGQMLVLFTAFMREGRVVAVQESRPFQFQPGQRLSDAPLPGGAVANGYPSPDVFRPGDEFLTGDKFLSGDQFITLNPNLGLWVQSKGRDTLVLAVLPADPRERAEARIRPLFISAGDGFVR